MDVKIQNGPLPRPPENVVVDILTEHRATLAVKCSHPSGTPASRMPSLTRSRPADGLYLNLHRVEIARMIP